MQLGDSIMHAMVFSRELRSLQAHYPIFFCKDSDTGNFYPAALFGLEQGENFILSERLGIINNLNEIFINMPSIQKNKVYWKLIQRGLCDLDIYCRKMALTILH